MNINSSRAEFEEWAFSEGLPVSRREPDSEFDYAANATQVAWRGWCAARVREAVQAEVVGKVYRYGSGFEVDWLLEGGIHAVGIDGDTYLYVLDILTPNAIRGDKANLLARAAEVVHHDADCPAIDGNGDADCRCDAVAFLRDLEAAIRGDKGAEAVAVPRLPDVLTLHRIEGVLADMLGNDPEDGDAARIYAAIVAAPHAGRRKGHSMSTELLPCPFCGAEPNIGRWKEAIDQSDSAPTAIECSSDLYDCPVNPSVARWTREETVAAWNTRPAAQRQEQEGGSHG